MGYELAVYRTTKTIIAVCFLKTQKLKIMKEFDWSKVSNNDEVIDLIKQKVEIEKKIRAIDKMALVKFELECLNTDQ